MRDLPYWAVIPWCLVETYRGQRPMRHYLGFLQDVVWGQYCLFVGVRVQDDLFDGQAADRALMFAANQFLVEAERTFATHFPHSSHFWELFRQGIERTTRSILRADALQRRPASRPSDILQAYSGVDSIFDVAAGAVCMRFRRRRHLSAVAAFRREMAVASQIVDDLQDVADDLRSGRVNYAARMLVNAGARERILGLDPLPGSEVAATSGESVHSLLGEARHRLKRAALALRRVRCRPAGSYLAAFDSALEDLQGRAHRREVESKLGPILSRGQPPTRAAQTAEGH